MILDEESFVDLYEVLALWPEADTAALRSRISELYLESRNNLEHQSHRKRFYYRELYEVHLPLARQLLLDKQKRAEYDVDLQDYFKKRGKPRSIRKPRDTGKTRLDDLPGVATVEIVDPFAEFADVIDEIPLPPVRAAVHMNPKDVENRRNLKRRELIKHELISQGRKWGLIGGLGTAIGLLLIVIVVLSILQFNSPIAYGVALIAIMALAVFVSRQAMRTAKKGAIATLSQMPYDELLRHCSR